MYLCKLRIWHISVTNLYRQYYGVFYVCDDQSSKKLVDSVWPVQYQHKKWDPYFSGLVCKAWRRVNIRYEVRSSRATRCRYLLFAHCFSAAKKYECCKNRKIGWSVHEHHTFVFYLNVFVKYRIVPLRKLNHVIVGVISYFIWLTPRVPEQVCTWIQHFLAHQSSNHKRRGFFSR